MSVFTALLIFSPAGRVAAAHGLPALEHHAADGAPGQAIPAVVAIEYGQDAAHLRA